MSNVDKAINYVQSNMIMLDSICYNDEKYIPEYILNILKKHKKEVEEQKKWKTK